MNAWSELRGATRLVCAALCLVWCALAGAAPIEDFTTSTWARWQKELPRPAIVVFSTTYCPTCPGVMASLAASVKQAGGRVPLIAVIMDAGGRREVAHAAHFAIADRLFAFRGEEAALRFSVDPRWRGLTPYVALFGPSGPPKFAAGLPSAAQLDALLVQP